MEKVAKLKKFSSKLKSFVVGCHVMYSVSDFKFLPISCKGLQRVPLLPTCPVTFINNVMIWAITLSITSLYKILLKILAKVDLTVVFYESLPHSAIDPARQYYIFTHVPFGSDKLSFHSITVR